MEEIIEELANEQGVLCIENLAQLIENPDEVDSSLASFFAPYLRSKQIRMVGEMTPEELQEERKRGMDPLYVMAD